MFRLKFVTLSVCWQTLFLKRLRTNCVETLLLGTFAYNMPYWSGIWTLAQLREQKAKKVLKQHRREQPYTEEFRSVKVQAQIGLWVTLLWHRRIVNGFVLIIMYEFGDDGWLFFVCKSTMWRFALQNMTTLYRKKTLWLLSVLCCSMDKPSVGLACYVVLVFYFRLFKQLYCTPLKENCTEVHIWRPSSIHLLGK